MTFLEAVSAAAQTYLDAVLWGRAGGQPVAYPIGQGDVDQGVAEWIAVLEAFEQALVDAPIPDGVEAAALATSAGLEMTGATREWLEGLRQEIDGGGYVDPVLVISQINERLYTAEQQRWLAQRQVLRNEYGIGSEEVPIPSLPTAQQTEFGDF